MICGSIETLNLEDHPVSNVILGEKGPQIQTDLEEALRSQAFQAVGLLFKPSDERDLCGSLRTSICSVASALVGLLWLASQQEAS